jgi:thioredoxin-related protein
MVNQDYTNKYLKYKNKYLNLKQNNIMIGGNKKNKNDKENVLLFKSENCGWCTKFETDWNRLKEGLNSKYNFISYEFTDKNHKEQFEKYNIKGFPTLLINDNGTYVEYNGERDYKTLYNYLDTKK